MAPLQQLLGPAASAGVLAEQFSVGGARPGLSEKHDDVCRMGGEEGGFKPLPQPSQWPAAMLDCSPSGPGPDIEFDSIPHLARGSSQAAELSLQLPGGPCLLRRCVREVTTASWHPRHEQAVKGSSRVPLRSAASAAFIIPSTDWNLLIVTR
jgi:hypothetical protein